MIYGSLRFDDMLHVKPATIEWKQGVMYGSCWQAKVERKRRGTKFAVPDVSLANVPWLTTGWKVFAEVGTLDRDYLLANVKDWNHMVDEPVHYNKFVLLFRTLIVDAWKRFDLAGWEKPEVDSEKFTAPSCRTTMLDAGSHAEVSPTAQMAQANWVSPEMLLRYTRSNKQIAVNMIYGLVEKVKKGWRPGFADADALEESEDEDAEEPNDLVFFIK